MSYISLRIKQEELGLHPNRGNIFESFIISEIVKWYYNKGDTPPVYFWRDNHDHEIDCIIEDGQKLTPVEIKSSRTVKSQFFDGLKYFNQLTEEKYNEGLVVFAGSKKQPQISPNVISWQELEKIF